MVIYQTPDGKTQIDVRLENETVWLTQTQMAELFEKDQSVVARHINNAFKEGELEKESNMHFLHNTQYKYRPTMIYSLDVVISVGYRVHSKRGTAFRIWARQIIKDYLVRGYAVNQRIHSEQIGELRQLVGMLGRTIQSQPVLSTDETNALFEVVTDYSYALDTLDNNGRKSSRNHCAQEPLRPRHQTDIDVGQKTKALDIFGFRSFLNIGMLLTTSEEISIKPNIRRYLTFKKLK